MSRPSHHIAARILFLLRIKNFEILDFLNFFVDFEMEENYVRLISRKSRCLVLFLFQFEATALVVLSKNSWLRKFVAKALGLCCKLEQIPAFSLNISIVQQRHGFFIIDFGNLYSLHKVLNSVSEHFLWSRLDVHKFFLPLSWNFFPVVLSTVLW